VVALLVTVPMILAMQNEFAIEGGNYIRVYPLKYSAARSYDVLTFVLPNARSSFYRALPMTPRVAGVNAAINVEGEGQLSPDRQAFPGYTALVLGIFTLVRRWRDARFWFFSALAFWIFALGPSLHIVGNDTGLPLPFLALHEIPIVNHIRIPMRYGVMVFFAWSVMVGVGTSAIRNSKFVIQNSKSPISNLQSPICNSLVFGIPILMLLEFAVLPFPVQPVPIPRVYEQIARVPGDFAVLEIPSFDWRDSARAEVYQTVHGKRILRAYTNRIAPDLADYFAYRQTPIVVRSLRVLEGVEAGTLTEDDLAEDRAAVRDVLRFYDLRFIVLHRDWMDVVRADAADKYVREVLNARAVFDENQVVGYEIPRAQTAPEAIRIDLGTNLAQMYLGRGWQIKVPPDEQDDATVVWARGMRSEIYLPAVKSAAPKLRGRVWSESAQRVGVRLNDALIGEINARGGWNEFEFAPPALAAQMNRVKFGYAAPVEKMLAFDWVEIR
jgi:hypothetical protein